MLEIIVFERRCRKIIIFNREWNYKNKNENLGSWASQYETNKLIKGAKGWVVLQTQCIYNWIWSPSLERKRKPIVIERRNSLPIRITIITK